MRCRLHVACRSNAAEASTGTQASAYSSVLCNFQTKLANYYTHTARHKATAQAAVSPCMHSCNASSATTPDMAAMHALKADNEIACAQSRSTFVMDVWMNICI